MLSSLIDDDIYQFDDGSTSPLDQNSFQSSIDSDTENSAQVSTSSIGQDASRCLKRGWSTSLEEEDTAEATYNITTQKVVYRTGKTSRDTSSTSSLTRDSEWDFNTLRITNTEPVDSTHQSGGSLAASLHPQTSALTLATHSNSLDGEEIFDTILKPAVFDMIQDYPTTGASASTSALCQDTREELLLDLLHSFENLNHQDGLLAEFLDKLTAYTASRMKEKM